MVYFVNISKLIPEFSNSTSPLSLDFFMVSYFSGSYFHVFSPMTQPRLAKALHERRDSQNRAASYERHDSQNHAACDGQPFCTHASSKEAEVVEEGRG